MDDQKREITAAVAARIRSFRKKAAMSQEELARRVNVRRETISCLEKGRYNPSLVLAWKIARVFDTTIEDVFLINETDE